MGMVVLMVGLPGSGKTTIACKHYPDFEKVSLDEIKNMPKHERYSLVRSYKPDGLPIPPSNNRKAEHVLIATALQKGLNVVIDDTNLTREIRAPHIEHASRYRYPVYAISLCNAKTAIKRNKARSGRMRVPDGIMLKMQREYEPPKMDEGFESIRTIL